MKYLIALLTLLSIANTQAASWADLQEVLEYELPFTNQQHQFSDNARVEKYFYSLLEAKGCQVTIGVTREVKYIWGDKDQVFQKAYKFNLKNLNLEKTEANRWEHYISIVIETRSNQIKEIELDSGWTTDKYSFRILTERNNDESTIAFLDGIKEMAKNCQNK